MHRLVFELCQELIILYPHSDTLFSYFEELSKCDQPHTQYSIDI